MREHRKLFLLRIEKRTLLLGEGGMVLSFARCVDSYTRYREFGYEK